MDCKYDWVFFHCVSKGIPVFLCFGKAHVPPDGHDFLHCQTDVTLDQHNGFFAVPEGKLIIDLIGLHGLPDVLPLGVALDLP